MRNIVAIVLALVTVFSLFISCNKASLGGDTSTKIDETDTISDNTFEKEKEEYEKNIKSLENKIFDLEIELKTLEDKIKEFDESNLVESENVYTQTFRYISDYDYAKGMNNIRFIIVDQFQEFNPKMLSVNKSRFTIDFVEDHFYEITFKAVYKGNQLLEKIEIIDIVETEKTGFEQVQQPGWV